MAVPVNSKEVGTILGLIFVLGLILLIIQKYSLTEGFASPARCGVDDAPCPPGQKCINGFCAIVDPKPICESDPVPLLPEGGPAPYF